MLGRQVAMRAALGVATTWEQWPEGQEQVAEGGAAQTGPLEVAASCTGLGRGGHMVHHKVGRTVRGGWDCEVGSRRHPALKIRDP